MTSYVIGEGMGTELSSLMKEKMKKSYYGNEELTMHFCETFVIVEQEPT